MKEKLKEREFIFFFSFIFFLGSYFSFLHYYNNGHFDFARTVFSCFFYLFLVPVRFFNLRNLGLLVNLASLFTATKGIYDSFLNEGIRIGQVVNPGPSAYVFGLLLILQVCFTIVEFRRGNYQGSFFCVILSFLLIYTVYLTGTRTAWLGLFLVLVYLLIYLFKKKSAKSGAILCIFVVLVLVGLFKVDYTHERISRSIDEVQMMLGGDYNTSSGTRVDLWFNGIAIGKENFLIGVPNDKEREAVQNAYENNEIQFSAYRILDHPRSSYHNVYIQSFVKGGLIALFLMLVWVFMPIVFSKSDVLNISMPITIMTVICSGFESQFTIYSACAYFYLLLVGYLILMDRSNDRSEV
ncbi:O-antigen ligase family protein [Vibrio tubiashii]|uniref:O-antigen ligase family protein n=1 Tax=Vibrio tubiashii TaxID=29498 RepID=UPI00148E4266